MRKISNLPRHSNEADRRQSSLNSLTIEQLKEAQNTLLQYIDPTPVIRVDLSPLGISSHCSLKLEQSTPTGSFKVRGATFCLKRLSNLDNNSAQVVTASTGNHGIGLAWAGKQLGIKVTVIAPNNIPDKKVKKLEAFGATLVIKGETLDDAIEWARAHLDLNNSIFIPSFNPSVIVGHSTLGLELLQNNENLDTVFFPVGIGSGIAGLTLARDLLDSSTKVIGVVPQSVRAWAESWKSGKPTHVRPTATFADGLRTALPDRDIFNYLRSKLSNILEVSENEIQEAQQFCSNYLNFTPEPAGVVGFAGLIQLARTRETLVDSLASVICG